MKKFLSLSVALATTADAGTFFVSQNGSGATNSSAWLAQSTNWNNGAGTIQPGDTVKLEGTFTNPMTLGGGGTSAGVVTVLFDTNANFTQQASNSITLGANNWLTIDGGYNGLIQNTNNGSTLGRHVGIDCINSSPTVGNVTIQNLTITNIYVRSTNTDENVGGGADIYFHPSSGVTNLVARNNHCCQNDFGILVSYPAGWIRDIHIDSNTLDHCNEEIRFGDANGGAIITNLTTAGNVDNGGYGAWDDVVGNDYHHNFLHIYEVNSGSEIVNALIACNRPLVNNGSETYQTALIFLEGGGSGYMSQQNFKVVNNFLMATNGGMANGAIQFSYATNMTIANNTIFEHYESDYGIRTTGATVTNCNIFNNLMVACSPNNPCIGLSEGDWYNHRGGFNSDYNAYYPWDGANVSIQFAGVWQGGEDAHSFTVTTNTFYLVTPANPYAAMSLTNSYFSGARAAGTNLFSQFTTDFFGNTRTNIGAWDLGAFAFQNSTNGALPLPPPVGFIQGYLQF